MKDPRMQKLANKLVNYSLEIKPGEKVLIEMIGSEIEIIKELIKEVYKAGGIPFYNLINREIQRVLLTECTAEQIIETASYEIARMKEMAAYIAIRAGENVNEMGAVPPHKMKIYNEHYLKPLHLELRVEKTRWVVLRYPNHSMAQLASMSTDDFEEFYYSVCNLDYSKMAIAMDNLVEFMERADRVKITGAGTDLAFSIKNMKAIKCDGKRNIPDGEVFTAPIRDSVQGYITYNTPAVYEGVTYENIRLEFE
ncbi:MAG: aminopeptidase, partial [Clostridiales bacterium]|nr:aminopeptidase [Clostridiales bacterium]